MKDLLEISCGLDVHKDKIVACILSGPIGKPLSLKFVNLPLLSLIWLLYATGLFPVTAIMSLWKALAFTGSLFMKSLKMLILVISLCLLLMPDT